MADASAEGFSIVTQYPELKLKGRDGMWTLAFARGGSNLRESHTFVNGVLVTVKSGEHNGCTIWAGTDNAVWSLVWNKGMSTVKHLFALAVELKVECIKHDPFLSFFHISGNRMIATGVDRRSRGNLDAGVSLGYDIHLYLPLDKGAFEVAGPIVERWCKSWMGKDFTPPLEPVEWFWEAHCPGIHLRVPPSGCVSGAASASKVLTQKTSCSDPCLCLSKIVVAGGMEEKI